MINGVCLIVVDRSLVGSLGGALAAEFHWVATSHAPCSFAAIDRKCHWANNRKWALIVCDVVNGKDVVYMRGGREHVHHEEWCLLGCYAVWLL
jgi:hypothetical protein